MLERLRDLRKALGFTQAEFGKKLAMGQTGWGMIENGNRGISDRTVAAICAIFGVNEKWLREGIGEMFVVTDKSIIDEVAERYNFGETEKKLLEAYISLPKEQRDMMTNIIKKFALSITVISEPEKIAGRKTKIFKVANSKDHQVQPSYEMVDKSEIDALFDLPDTDQK